MPDAPPIVVAPLLYGLIASCPLYGLSIAQAVFYYRTYAGDPRLIKGFIALLMVLETAHTLLIAHASNVWYLRAALAFVLPKSLLASGYVAYVVISLVQMAYMVRVYRISAGNKWIPVILYLRIQSSMSLLQLRSLVIVCGCGMNTTLALNVGLISIHHTSAEIFGGLQLAASVVCDVLITGSLVWYLRRGRGAFKQLSVAILLTSTQNLVDRLVIYSINIGLVTSMLSLVAMITWFAMPDNFIFTTFHILIGKVYVNSWLVTLNTRKTIRSTAKSSRYKFEVNSSGVISNGTGTVTTSDVMQLSTFRA
ncbi:hypothetical protein PLEOSDRAFT_1086817 [Pleurotus ostreatus PC15]|uniref:DUF6534 domain-containing protein n=1 Tax=Pleurotus ostreatus (strain PC15) TaxID=1137138 RepID=A0A067NHC3_PLEO1|nr:hypothetical protein PLEOSDRAFT_1086817 [Pleurotus ostreatus PC15]